MVKMKLFLCAFLAVFGAAYGDTSKWTEFRVKYSPVSTGVGVDSYWPVMKTSHEAHLLGWSQATIINPLGCRTFCYRTDFRVCALYDPMGTIAGMMLSIPVADVEGHGIPYDFNDFPVYQKQTIRGVSYWTSTYYLVDPEVILAGGRPHDVEHIGDGLWIKSGDEYKQIPTDLQSIKDTTPYTWQNCIPSMGIHYYYNMSVNTRCEDAQPFFLLVKEDNIVGLGWQFNGRTTPVIRNYYDDINSVAVKATVPLSPPCLAEGADEYGVISIHMYFVENPWTIPCNQSIDSVVPIPGLP